MSHNVTVACAASFSAVAIVFLMGAGPARTPGSVTYSDDGREWTTTLPAPLFDRGIRWVPGDERTTEFHIFNDTDEDGRLLLIVDSQNSVVGRSLAVSIDGAATLPHCASTTIAAGVRKRVDAVVSMVATSANETQNSTAVVDLLVQWESRNSRGCVASGSVDTEEQQEGAQR